MQASRPAAIPRSTPGYYAQRAIPDTLLDPVAEGEMIASASPEYDPHRLAADGEYAGQP